jgi:hypothetical protein
VSLRRSPQHGMACSPSPSATSCDSDAGVHNIADAAQYTRPIGFKLSSHVLCAQSSTPDG